VVPPEGSHGSRGDVAAGGCARGGRGTIDYWFATSERRIHKYVHHYLLEATGGHLTIDNDPDHEAIDVAWLPLREAHEHLTFPNERRIARQAWARLSGDG
jgi:hypothetical protein